MYSGSFVALVTPFDKDGKINYLKIAELIDFHKNNGTDGIVLLGTTGEAPTITEAETEKMILFAIDKAGEMPLIIGCGSNDTRAATEKSRKYEALGAKALLVLTPYYNKANDIGMIRHFMSIADAVIFRLLSIMSRRGRDAPFRFPRSRCSANTKISSASRKQAAICRISCASRG